MTGKVVALMGAGIGPLVNTSRLREPHLILEREPQGTVSVHYHESQRVDVFNELGRHPLQESRGMRVQYDGSDSKLVCLIGGVRA